MAENIKSIFDRHGKHIKFDKQLLKQIKDYGNGFVNASEDNIHFFGGNAIGVYPVRFKPADRHSFLTDILGLEESEIRNEVKNLPTVNEDWVRGTDVMNLSCLWLAHRFKISGIAAKDAEEGLYQSILILNFKLITSLMMHFFPHPVSPELSQMIYDELSMKYTLRKEGSWMGLMNERTEDIISPRGIHADTLTKFNDDGDIQYMITDVQGRLRSIIKNLWVVLDDIRKREMKRHKQSYFSDLEGEIVIRDMSKRYSSYRTYIEGIISSTANEFIKPDLITVISSMLPTMPKHMLALGLVEFHKQYGRKNKQVVNWLALIITHCFEQVMSDPKTAKKVNNIPDLLIYMRSLYMASKSKGDVETMRMDGGKFVKKYVKASNESIVSPVRTGIMLYILLRMFAKDHYG